MSGTNTQNVHLQPEIHSYLAIWLERFHSTCYPSNKTCPTNRDYDSINIRDILDDLKVSEARALDKERIANTLTKQTTRISDCTNLHANCSSSRDDRWVVITIHVSQIFFRDDFFCEFL